MEDLIATGGPWVLGFAILVVQLLGRRENSRQHQEGRQEIRDTKQDVLSQLNDAKSSLNDLINSTSTGLGISIDRVEETALRTEVKLDEHIRDHATGAFVKQ